MAPTDLKELTHKAKLLVRERKYKISLHVLHDNPERNITAADILHVLKEGEIHQLEVREVDGNTKYEGPDRFRWLGEDAAERVLRLAGGSG